MGPTFSTGQRFFFFGLLAASTILFMWMIHGYLFPVFWALVFALLLSPMYHWLRKRIGYDSVSALIVMLGALLLVVIPVAWISTQVTQEAFAFYRSAANNGILGSLVLPEFISDILPVFGTSAGELQADIAAWAQTMSSWVISEAFAISSATFNIVLKTILMLYFLFFFLRDGEKLGHYIMRRLPLGDRKERALFERFSSTTRAIMKGAVFSAIAQGVVGGIIFAVVGIENATLWGAVMAFLSVIPAVGPALVWIPAGLFLLSTGAIIPAIIVLVGGAALISPIDNILKPLLIGREIQMPDALILISILGGIAVFGIAGIIVGPVIAALLLAVWDIFAKEYEVELSAQG